MSLVPFFYDDDFFPMSAAAPRYTRGNYGDWAMMPTNFGSALSDMDRSSRAMMRRAGAGVKNTSDKFMVSMDVKGFKPNELKVKVQDRMVTVTGTHEEREDEHGYISRSFTRRYTVPEGIKMENVTSNISAEGVLNITAPKLHAVEAPKEMEVEIVKPKEIKQK